MASKSDLPGFKFFLLVGDCMAMDKPVGQFACLEEG